MLGVNKVYKDAKKGGIQAYQGHSSYMRGKKIKVLFREKVGVELTEEQKEEGGEGYGEQAIGVDGMDLTYRKSVTWEIFPSNIEVMLDTESYFLDNGAFPESVNADTMAKRTIAEIVDRIWADYDTNNSGGLDRNETRKFLQETIVKMGDGSNYQEEDFEDTFNMFDMNQNGLIEKPEMALLIKKLVRRN